MSLQDLNALAGTGTFVVITVTAIAALLQIRHLRVANQLQSFLHIMESLDSPGMIKARQFCLYELDEKLHDPAFVANESSGFGDARITIVGNFFSEVGTLVADGTLEERYYLSLLPLASQLWSAIRPVVEIKRAQRGAYTWVEFEYLFYLESTGIYQRKRLARLPKEFRERYNVKL